MPMMPTVTAMSTFSTAPPFNIHSESDTLKKDRNTTTHTNTSSMASFAQISNSTPDIIVMMSGNNVPRLAIHSGKFSQ